MGEWRDYFKALRDLSLERMKRIGPVGQQLAVGLDNRMPPARELQEYLQGYSQMPWMRAVLSKIAYGVANTRWLVQGIKGPTGKTLKSPIARLPLDARRKAIMGLKADGMTTQTYEEHPLLTLLANPCPLFPGIDGSMLWSIYVDLAGECFQLIERGEGGLPMALYPMPPHWVKEVPSSKDPNFTIQHRNFLMKVPMQDMLWDRDLDPLFPYGRGVGLMRTLSDELDANEYAARLVNYQFYNMNRPDMIVTIEGANDDKLMAFKETWSGALQGVRRAFRTFFWNKPIQVEKIQSDFVHSQLQDMLRWLRDVIHQVPGVPPEMLGILDNSNRATITAAEYIMAKHVIEPRVEKRRAFLQMHVIPMYDDRILLDFESPIPKDREMQLKAAQAAPVGTRVNDWRDFMDLPPIEGPAGDMFIVTSGTKLVTDLKELEGGEANTPEQLLPFTQPPGKPPNKPPQNEPEEVGATGTNSEQPEEEVASVTVPLFRKEDLSPDGRILLERAEAVRLDPMFTARLLCILHEKDVAWSEPEFGRVDQRDYDAIDQFLADWNGTLRTAV